VGTQNGAKTGALPPLDWDVLRAIARVPWQREWCGGVHRGHLAAMFGYGPYDKPFVRYLMVAHKQTLPDGRPWIVFCGPYVVKPGPVRPA
jgi:hypothetical protein